MMDGVGKMAYFREQKSTAPSQATEDLSHIKAVYLLRNAISYYLQEVYIVDEGFLFRLVVIHHDRVVLDKFYKSLNAAKSGFSLRYGWKLWDKGSQPTWFCI
jgi:hypothetical protein